MPYPGGKHGVGHYVPAADGSFSNPPFVLRDQVLESTNFPNFQVLLRWRMGSNPLDGTLSWSGPAGDSDIPITTLPLQFWDGLPVPPNPPNGFAVRRSVDLGPDNITLGDLAALGTWFPDGIHEAFLQTAAFGTTVENTSTYEMAFFADVSTVLARANITLRYIRA